MGDLLSHKKKIGSITRPKPNIPEQKPNYSDQFYIDLTHYHNWTHSINEKYFVNSLKDAEEAARYFYFIINTLLPDLERMGKGIFSGKYKHCHRIDGKKIKVARKIVKKIHNFDLSGDEDLWQLTARNAGGLRIVGAMVHDDMCRFYPLFIDYHHYLYQDKNYNQKDLRNYTFFPQEYFEKKAR